MTKQSKILIWSVVAGLVVLVAAPIAITLGFSTLGTKSVTATKIAIPPASESPTVIASALPSGFEPESVHAGQNRVEHHAAHVFKIAVDTNGASLGNGFGE